MAHDATTGTISRRGAACVVRVVHHLGGSPQARSPPRSSLLRVQYAAPHAAVFHTHRDCPVGRTIPGTARVSGGEAGGGRVLCETCEAMSDPRPDGESFRLRRHPGRRP